MAEKHEQREQTAEAVDSAEARREQQNQRDPSGHGMQVTPRQQQHVSETSPDPAEAAQLDKRTLEDLKGDNSG
jgi:hypothetical protein